MMIIALFMLFTGSLAISWNEYLERFPNVERFLDSEYHFLENIRYMRETNHSFELGITPFTHLSNKQFQRRFYNLTVPQERNFERILYSSELPSKKDWVEDGAVTDVKDQGQCGSCWSFSTTGSLEGAWYLAKGELVSLSEQQFVDCSRLNMGCNGGLPDRAFRYAEKYQICGEDDYQYTAKDGECKSCDGVIDLVHSYVDVEEGDEDALQNALMINPLAVAIQADSREFQLYKGGIMDFDCGNNLDHAVLLVGFGTEDGVDYWKLKNSWGTSWGEDGYFRLVRGKDMCGLADCASYPVF